MTNTIDISRELSLTRVYRAPRDLILKMWSDPVMLTRWWGPFGFSTTTHEQDFKPGGVWRFTMHGPDGTDYSNLIRYSKTGPDAIVYDHFAGDSEDMHFHAHISFEEMEGNKTKMEFRMVFPTAEEREKVVEKYRAGQGLLETTTRLDEILAETQSAADPFKMFISLPSATEIKVVRSLRAPIELVYRAYTDAKLIGRWQGPREFKCTECEFDARPGGKWHMTHVGPDGSEYKFRGDVLEVDVPRRIVSTFEFLGFPGAIQTNTLTLEEVDGITKITTLSSFDNQEHRDAMLNSGMEYGMSVGFERLEELMPELAGGTN